MFENCKSRTVKSKSGVYNEEVFIPNSKGIFKEYTGEINSKGKGKVTKTDTKESSSRTRNKKFIKEIYSTTGHMDENKLMLFN